MNALRNRIEKLEVVHHGSGKLAVVRVGTQSDDIVNAAISAEGLDPKNPNNLVVILRTLYLGKDNEVAQDNLTPVEVLQVMDLR